MKSVVSIKNETSDGLDVAELQHAFFRIWACWRKLETSDQTTVDGVAVLGEFLRITAIASFLHFHFVQHGGKATVVVPH